MCWRSRQASFSIGNRPRCTCKMWSYLLDPTQLLVLDKGADSPSQSQSRQATQQRQHANMQDVPSGRHGNEATSAFTGWPFCLACSVRPRHWPKSSHRSRCHVVPCPAAERATFTPCKAVLAVSRTRILVSLHVPCTTSSRWTPSSLEVSTVHVPIESSIKRIPGSLDCSALKLTHRFKFRVRIWITQGRSRNLQAFRCSHHSKEAYSCIS